MARVMTAFGVGGVGIRVLPATGYRLPAPATDCGIGIGNGGRHGNGAAPGRTGGGAVIWLQRPVVKGLLWTELEL